MLVVGGNLTNAQWEYLCRSRNLADDKLKSMSIVNKGLRELEAYLPTLDFLIPGYPGCAFDPEKLIDIALSKCIADLELDGEFSKTIVAALADDGASEGLTKLYPMLLETLNFVQDPNCQSVLKCHVLAIAR